MKTTELQTMVVSELKALAKKMSVSLSARAKKADIVEALATAFKQKTTTRPAAGKPSAEKGRGAAPKKSESARKNPPAAKKGAAQKKQSEPKRIPIEKPAVEIPPTGREWKMPPGTEEPLMAQERVADAKYYTGPGQNPGTQEYGELPSGYGEEKITLMVRDPSLAYAYWEVTPSRLQREKSWFGLNGKLTVRIYDVTDVQFDGRNAIGYFDQEVDDLTGNWYFDLGRPSHSFIADIGLLAPEGRFLTLARSNYVIMPQDGVSDVVDEEWMMADEEFWKLYGFPGGPSSPQMQEMIRLRKLQHVSSPGVFSRTRRK
jgi:hypothetical protein